MWSIVQVWSPQNTIVNYQDRSDSVRSMTKMRHDNDVTNRTSLLYAKNETEFSWVIWHGTVYDKDQTWHRHD